MKPAEQLRDLLSNLPMMTSYDGIAGEEDLRHAYKVGFADAQHAALKALAAVSRLCGVDGGAVGDAREVTTPANPKQRDV